jgi:hypothetical protein
MQPIENTITASAMLARWMIEHRTELLRHREIAVSPKSVPLFERKDKTA